MITDEDDYILLKWGTLKGFWLRNSSESLSLLQKYLELGYDQSAALQKYTQEQKELLCQAVEKLNGIVQNDWTGKEMSKEAAIKYIKEYGK